MIYKGKKGLFQLYKEHYENNDLDIKEIHRREIAFSDFTKGFNIRDRANYFETPDELRNHIALRIKPPSGVFSSTGYYLDPNEIVPSKRDLQKFDFVMDLDSLPYENESKYDFIDRMRKLTIELIDNFLVDLGFPIEDMAIEFSGNKGFHLSFDTPEYIKLNIKQRLQIQDYIVANNKKLDVKNTFGIRNKLYSYGWNKQMYHFLEKLIDDTSIEHLEQYFTKKEAKKISDLLNNPAVSQRLESGHLADFDYIVLVRGMLKNHRTGLGSVYDRKPTIDQHRVFRVPGSLHPKSGLPSVRLDRYQLGLTDLIIDQIMYVSGEDDVEVELENEVVIDFPVTKTIPKGSHVLKRYEALCALTVDNMEKWK